MREALLVEGAALGFLAAIGIVEIMLGAYLFAIVICAFIARIYLAHIRPRLSSGIDAAKNGA